MKDMMMVTIEEIRAMVKESVDTDSKYYTESASRIADMLKTGKGELLDNTQSIDVEGIQSEAIAHSKEASEMLNRRLDSIDKLLRKEGVDTINLASFIMTEGKCCMMALNSELDSLNKTKVEDPSQSVNILRMMSAIVSDAACINRLLGSIAGIHKNKVQDSLAKEMLSELHTSLDELSKELILEASALRLEMLSFKLDESDMDSLLDSVIKMATNGDKSLKDLEPEYKEAKSKDKDKNKSKVVDLKNICRRNWW